MTLLQAATANGVAIKEAIAATQKLTSSLQKYLDYVDGAVCERCEQSVCECDDIDEMASLDLIEAQAKDSFID